VLVGVGDLPGSFVASSTVGPPSLLPSIGVSVDVVVDLTDGVGVAVVESIADSNVRVGVGVCDLAVGLEVLLPHATANPRIAITAGNINFLANITSHDGEICTDDPATDNNRQAQIVEDYGDGDILQSEYPVFIRGQNFSRLRGGRVLRGFQPEP